MRAEQEQVREFMTKAGQECPTIPTLPSDSVKELRLKLIREELKELSEAFEKRDPVEVYDAIIDILVVTIGAANALGFDLEPGWQEVHRSNMSKFIDGHRREDGKWIKPPDWVKPDLESIIAAQLNENNKPHAGV